MASKKETIMTLGDNITEATAASLSERAQQIVDALNDKRKEDTDMLAEFKPTLVSHIEAAYGQVEQHMYQTYDKQGKEFNSKVQELFECLERVATLEKELAEFKQDLASFCSSIDH